MIIRLIGIILVFPLVVYAQPEDRPLEKKVENATQQVEKAVENSRERRGASKYLGLVDYSYFDLILPSKIGLTAAYIRDADTTWEVEYLRGSLSVPFFVDDIGSMTDQRVSLVQRSFVGKNSFNFSYGVTFFDFRMKVGNAILSRLAPSAPSGIDVVSLQSFGVNVGFGNRWTFKKNITVGVDWLDLYQPIIITKKDTDILKYMNNDNDRDNMNKVLKFVSYFPRFAAIKFQLGMSF